MERLAVVLCPGACPDTMLLDPRRISQTGDIYFLHLQGRTKDNGKTRDAERSVAGVLGKE